MLDTAIIGGGLCGLAVANSLHAQHVDFALYEARKRLGGRVLSIRCETARMTLDLGPTWFWPDTQRRIARLVSDLGLGTFRQWDDGTVLSMNNPQERPSPVSVEDVHQGAMRVDGGMGMLIQALAARVPEDSIHLGWALTEVVDRGSHVELQLRQGEQVQTVSARRVVLAVPPRLLEERVRFDPPLPDDLTQVMRDTPTWMAGHAKVVIGYEDAFWRDKGFSGNAFANHPQAVLGEIFDACDPRARRAALGAFLSLPAALRDSFQQGLPLLIRSQLVHFFGPEAQRGEKHVQDWAQEVFTCSTLDRTPPSGHPSYGHPLLRQPMWHDKLVLGSSETASYGGGYLEGALEAAGRIRDQLLHENAQAA